jgi:broad specificity phosphatase PhoE
MDLLLVRHGQSESNRDGIMQGQFDSPLTDLGVNQARAVGRWLHSQGLRWDRAYASPLRRAQDTALQIVARAESTAAVLDPDLTEIHSGVLQGRSRAQMQIEHPEFFERGIQDLGDYAAFGGESYADVQARVERLITRLEERHGASQETVLIVSHGGLLFQLVKRLTCLPVPRVGMLRFGNCTCCLVNIQERRGTRLGEVVWHVPVQMMGGEASGGTARLLY